MSEWRIDIAMMGKRHRADRPSRQRGGRTDRRGPHVYKVLPLFHRSALFSFLRLYVDKMSQCKVQPVRTDHKYETQYCITSKCYRERCRQSLKKQVGSLYEVMFVWDGVAFLSWVVQYCYGENGLILNDLFFPSMPLTWIPLQGNSAEGPWCLDVFGGSVKTLEDKCRKILPLKFLQDVELSGFWRWMFKCEPDGFVWLKREAFDVVEQQAALLKCWDCFFKSDFPAAEKKKKKKKKASLCWQNPGAPKSTGHLYEQGTNILKDPLLVMHF